MPGPHSEEIRRCILLFLCTLGCVHPGLIKRARYATKHLRDTDSDYVMKKPSRCWLGAVPRYWNVVASSFQIVSFAENTSAALAPGARIFQPILLLRGGEMPVNTLHASFFQRFNQLLLIQPTTNAK